jgi:hypothetical protein
MSNRETDDANGQPDRDRAETPASNRRDPVAPSDAPDRGAQSDGGPTLEDALAQLEVLREENRRLREEYVRAQQSSYRRAATALAAFGAVAAVAGLLFVGVRETLFGLAGIGLVTAILVYFLTPSKVATATVGERSFAAFAALGDAIGSELGLQKTRVYVPTDEIDGTSVPAKLFVPLHESYSVPSPDELASVFVVETDEQTRGASLPPTGAMLVQECRKTMVNALASRPDALLDQLTEAVVSGFELAGDAVADLDAEDGTATVGVRDTTFGDVDRFDHPLASFLASGLAVGLETPVELAAISDEGEEFDYVVTCTWDSEAVEYEPTEEDLAGPAGAEV